MNTNFPKKLTYLWGLALALPACADGGPSDTSSDNQYLVVTSPAEGASISASADSSESPGLQVDVRAASNLPSTARLRLTVSNGPGSAPAAWPEQVSPGADGSVHFSDVTLPEGNVSLEVDCVSGCEVKAARAVEVIPQVQCALSYRGDARTRPHYGPLPVLNLALDASTDDGFQGQFEVQTADGYEVEFFVLDVDESKEESAGKTSSVAGFARTDVSLAEGRQAVRAVCSSPSGASGASPSHTYFVDVSAPSCALLTPEMSSTFIPKHDEEVFQEGLQFSISAQINSEQDDVEGEATVFVVAGEKQHGSSVDRDGQVSAQGSFEEAGDYEVVFSSQDHAGNSCSARNSVSYVTEGCSITHVAPTQIVSVDSDLGAPGLQSQVVVQVDPSCAGAEVVTSCDVSGAQSASVPVGGLTTIDVTLCESESCAADFECSTEVTSSVGIETSVDSIVRADTVPPNVLLQLVTAVLSCGGNTDENVDVDPETPGVQIDVRAVSPGADASWFTVENSDGTNTVNALSGGDAVVTLLPGVNTLVAYARDDAGNEGVTESCSLGLVDLVVGFTGVLSTGQAGSPNGVVSGSTLAVDLCGTVGVSGASVTVAIDGGSPQAATVTDTNWCLNGASLAEGSHSVEIDASGDGRLGEASATLVVDITGPDAATGLATSQRNRQGGTLAWDAPADAASYEIVYATSALSAANWDAATAVSAPTPASAGTEQSVNVDQLKAGTEYYFGIRSLDSFGNYSDIASEGPLLVDFATAGVFQASGPAPGDNLAFGYSVTTGNFNGDAFDDIAVAAPYEDNGATAGAGAVYVYFGSATGIDRSNPDAVLRGTEATGQFGYGLTAFDYDGDANIDLAVGAPFNAGFTGAVYVFTGSALAADPDGQLAQSDADATISGGGDFSFGGVGWSLTTANFDGNSQDDLVIGASAAMGGIGAVAIVHDGWTGDFTLGDETSMNSASAVAHVFSDGGAADFGLLGNRVFNLGKTEGSGDTRDDIGISHNNADAGTDDTFYVIRGRAKPGAPLTTLAFDPAQDLSISSPGEQLGFADSFAAGPDFNGDGSRDIFLPASKEGNGVVRVIDSSLVGAQTLVDATLLTLSAPDGESGFGSAVCNTSLGSSADLDSDGAEDAFIAGGSSLFVWYGGDLPNADQSADDAHHRYDGPAEFSSVSACSWIGDVDNNNLSDFFWFDADLDSAGSEEGVGEILFDFQAP